MTIKIETMTPMRLDEIARDWLRKKNWADRVRVLIWLRDHAPPPKWEAGLVAWAYWSQSVDN